MEMRVIGFRPPIVGVDDEFNTFRIGLFYKKRLNVGEQVLLLDEKEKQVFGVAEVVTVEAGPLAEMAVVHGHRNHTELENDPVSAPERLYGLLKQIYGPQVAAPHKQTSVIYLRRLKWQNSSPEQSST